MPILRKERRDHYTVIDNAIFRNYDLSYKAKGLLCQMLSLPDGWEFSIEGLTRLSTDGKSAVMSALNELKEAGYFRREQVREGNRIAGVEYIISEVGMSDFLLAENQNAENPPQYNTKELNTNKSTTKRFIPPTVEQVREYVERNGYDIDAEQFVDFYESKGWLVGKSKMKCWEAAVRNWQRRNNDRNDITASDRQRYRLRGTTGGSTGDNEIRGAKLPPME